MLALETDLFESHQKWRQDTFRCPYFPSAVPHGRAAVAFYIALDFPADGTNRSQKSYRRLKGGIADKFTFLQGQLQERGGYFAAELLGARALAASSEECIEIITTTVSHPYVNQTVIKRTNTGSLEMQSHRLYDDYASERLPLKTHIGMVAGQVTSLLYMLESSPEI